MNYIKELNAFYDWLESNPMPSDAIALWHALHAVCNKAGWPKEFTVANSTLQAKAGLSRVKLDRWRGFLKDKGLILYKKSDKVNEAGKYTLIPFNPIVQNDTQDDTQDDTRNDTQGDTQDVTQNDTQNEHIIKTKLNETKKDIYSADFERFWEVYPRKVGKQRAYACWKARIKEDSPDMLILCAQNYADSCKVKGTETEYIKHPSTFLSAKKDYADYISPLKTEYKTKSLPPGVNLELVQTTDEEAKWLEEMARRQRERNQAAGSS
ncbi:MAG: hypothetical protein IRZ03_18105 [Acidobacterium ailaaui]|nr:hypothetical protein [Pseudacidobacterium ailaaui]